MTDTIDTITLRSLHSAAAQGPFRAEIDATNRGRYDAYSIVDDYGAVATGIDPKTAEYWVAVLADALALFSAAEERDDLRKQLSATLDQLELRKDTVLWRDLQEVMRQHNETIAERDALRAEVADLKTWLIAFGAPSAARIASACGLPDGHLLPHHYDILARCDARMDSFTRADLAKETPNA